MCVRVFVELCFQQRKFFCFFLLRFGFTLFQRSLDFAFACVCLVGDVLCEIWDTLNWSYILCTRDKKGQTREVK